MFLSRDDARPRRGVGQRENGMIHAFGFHIYYDAVGVELEENADVDDRHCAVNYVCHLKT